jgi:hypothetical protein
MSATHHDSIWALLLHLSYNMWADRDAPDWKLDYVSAKPYLRFDPTLWDELLHRAVAAGLNMVVLDLGDGVRYASHPELVVSGAWTVERLRNELARMRALGLEPIPKLNFSATHDAWLGPYARCVSTPAYYAVCRDLIAEVIELFDQPRFFHLGMDEETAQHQRYYEYVVIRQGDLWWRDLFFYINEVEKAGVRAWVWSDYVWHHPEAFWQNMPRSVLQSNWYYGSEFGPEVERAKAYVDLEAHGYDQVPTGSNWTDVENMPRTVAFCRQYIAPERLLGFMQSIWKPTLQACRGRHLEAIAALERAKMGT